MALSVSFEIFQAHFPLLVCIKELSTTVQKNAVKFAGPAEVIEKRWKGEGQSSYYIHYTDCKPLFTVYAVSRKPEKFLGKYG